MKTFKINLLELAILISTLLVSSCSKDESGNFGPISFGTNEGSAEFYVNDSPLIRFENGQSPGGPSIPRAYVFSANNNGNEEVKVDYYVRKFVGNNTYISYASSGDLIDANTNDQIYIDAPITLKSEGNDTREFTQFTVDLSIGGATPSWDVNMIYSPGAGGGGNALIGEWMQVETPDGCTNVNGERNKFKFNENNTGNSFIAICNLPPECGQPYGLIFNYNWSSTDNTITLNYTSVPDYCGQSSQTPPPDTVTYFFNGDLLNINGNDYERIN